MLSHSKQSGLDISSKLHGNALIHRARNIALASVPEDADYVLMVDDDMMPERDALCRLVGHGLPVTSALCTTRVPPIQLAVKRYDEASGQFIPVSALRPGKVVSGPYGVGAAFLLIDRATIAALREYYLSARDWMAENRRLLDRLHVRVENRERERARKEQVRRAAWETRRMLRIFDYPVIENEDQLGEDIALSRKLLELGIPVAIDTSLPVAHIGEYTYGVWDVEDDDGSDRAIREHGRLVVAGH